MVALTHTPKDHLVTVDCMAQVYILTLQGKVTDAVRLL